MPCMTAVSCQVRTPCIACRQWRSKNMASIFFRSVHNKTIIRFGFCDIQNSQGRGRGHQPQPLASADNSPSRALCCLLSLKKQKHDFHFFFFIQCIIKQLIDSVFVISRIVKAEVGVISLNLWLRLITPTSTLIILDITKTSSINCLLPKVTEGWVNCQWEVEFLDSALAGCVRQVTPFTRCKVRVTLMLVAKEPFDNSAGHIISSQKKRPFLSNSFPR